ncbi:MAG: sigma-70 family RNA polymerase sigma factor [Bacteroidales bacterium]|jgi:RNA polymerase sigma-70 factor (ECF subfamily)|nr:sigma-70 family RNA polymerase sigma factor [Bacteroidales bacterium]OJX88970.1 MAG: RNA polymerase [Paludibacter sp. 47-17]
MSTTRYNEQELITAVRRGEARAQRELYERFVPTMFAVCSRYAPDPDTAKDLLQDGFVKVFTKIDSYAGTGSFEGWMRRVFVTTCLEFLRQKHALKFAASIDDQEIQVAGHEASVVEQLSANELMKLINSLSDGYRTVFNMYAIEGYSHAEIAQELGVNEVTSRTQFMRARKILQGMIERISKNGKK